MNSNRYSLVFIVILCALGANYSMARAQLLEVKPDRTEVFRDEIFLPKHSYLQMMGLNYNSFTSSMVWLSGLLYYGSYRIYNSKNKGKVTPPKHLGDYATLMVNIDPLFKSPFEWYASVYLYSRKTVTHDDLEKINEVLDIAIKYHPTDYRFSYMAGLNYIGYSAKRDPKTRLKELDKAIAYLERASQFKEAPDYLPFTVASLYNLKARAKAKLSKGVTAPVSDEEAAAEQREFYLGLYRSTIDEALRQRLASKLISLGLPPSQLQDKNQQQLNAFRRQYDLKRTYLPLDLWVWTTYPTQELAQ